MSRIRIVVVVAAAAVLLLGALVVLTNGHDPAVEETAGGSARGSSAGSQAGSGSKGDRPSELQQQPVATKAKSGKRADEGAAKGASEVSGAIGDRLAPVKKGPLVPAALPRSASGRGRLVSGYPHRVLPALPGSRVRSSSVSPSGRAVQVALVGATSRGQDAVAKFYRLRLARYGFKESALPAVGGSTALGFERGKDSVVLTLTPQGRRSWTYSLFGVLHAGAA